MSNRLLNLLRERSDIKGPAKAALFVLADRANDQGECWLSHATIAAEAGTAKSTVRKHLARLRERGEIGWINRLSSDGDQDTNLYRITLGGVGHETTHPGREAAGGEPRAGAGVGRETAEGRPRDGYKAPIKTPIEATMKQPPPIADLFETQHDKTPTQEHQTITGAEIYQAYPRKAKKPDALKAIAKAMKKCDPTYLLERTMAYAAAIVWQDHQFIPYPATWFNAEQFNDDPAEWAQPEAKPGQAGIAPPSPPGTIFANGRNWKPYTTES